MVKQQIFLSSKLNRNLRLLPRIKVDSSLCLLTMIGVLCFLLSSFTFASASTDYNNPLIQTPRLSHLDTSDGLSQNTIRDLHIDTHGFLWVANEEGIERYDGSKVIHVEGPQGEFLNTAVSEIFQDSRENMWISTEGKGVFKFDLIKREAKKIVDNKTLDGAGWRQYSEFISEVDNGDILIASDQQVDLFSYESGQVSTLFTLKKESLETGDIVRTAYKSGDLLLIGTSEGLFSMNLSTNKVTKIEFLPESISDESHENTQNVKQLMLMPNGQLWIGTVQGLYQISLGALKEFVLSDSEMPVATTIDSLRNIWSLKIVNDSNIYIGTDKGLYRTNLDGTDVTFLFEPRQNFQEISDKSILAIETDSVGNVWFGTKFNGAMFWSPKSTFFKTYSNQLYTKTANKLTNNNVVSLYQQNQTTLWAGTTNGLNRINLLTNQIEQFLKSDEDVAEYDESHVELILSNNQKELWLATGAGLRVFDIESSSMKELSGLSPDQAALFDMYSWGLVQQGNNIIWSLSDLGLVRFDTLNFSAELIDLKPLGLNVDTLFNIIGYDIRTSNLLLSTPGQLIGFNTANRKVEQLHSIESDGVSSSMLPTSWLRDAKNNFWLSYAGKALYQLDGNSFLNINKYSTDNYLSSNLIYGLALDTKDHLWFSSHSGIHEFSPNYQSLSTYQYMQGVSSTEFNQSAFASLLDGRLAYGSVNGITIFEPSQVSTSQTNITAEPVITEIELSSRQITMPYKKLNSSVLELEHDDIGLTVHFSSLDYAASGTQRYRYRLVSNTKVINFPGAVSNKVEFSILRPGEHVLEIYSAAAGPKAPAAAKLYINVKYSPLLSPLAVSIYILLLISSFVWFILRRNRAQAVLALANDQVTLYNKRLTSALKASNSDIWEWSSETNVITTPRLHNDLGYSADYLNIDFEKHLSLVHEVDRLQYLSAWRQFIRCEEEQFDNTYRVKSVSGGYLWFRDAGSISSSDNEIITVTGTYTNVTESIASKERLKLFGDAFKHTRDWVLVFDRDRQPLGGNPSFYNAFTIDEDTDFSAQLMYIIDRQEGMKRKFISKIATLKPSEHWETEFEFILNEKQVTTKTTVNAIANESDERLIEYYLVIMTDISEQVLAQESLLRLANYDELTGLVNRTLLIEKLKQSILYAKRQSTKLCVIFIDLDRFKPINDTFGHQAGDKVIVEIANRIKGNLRDNDIVSRLGGDEFVVVLEEVDGLPSVNKVVTQLLHAIEEPIYLDSHSVSVSGSAGIAMYPDDAVDAESLLRNSDVAMYSAKESGKNAYRHFTSSMNDKVQQDMLLQNKLKIAVSRNEFQNYYQAIINSETQQTVGFEMLMRWESESQYVSPAVFIPIAEQMGLIVDMTMRAIDRGLSDVASWYEKGFRGYIAINLSAKQFSKRPDFEKILELLNKHSLPTSCVRFEITEGLLVDNHDKTVDYMHEMRELGFKISLDDFGTGYSSLRYLKDFPIDVLKIDKSFVDDIGIDKGTESIIESTLIMTNMLKMDTVAEGIETKIQVAYFDKTNCRFLQGFFFSKPLPNEQCYDLLQKDWSSKFAIQNEIG
ncbi:MAG: diguanylate cyclase (GGDEF)-like protein [Glaciecola sp.]|jgi:diguanylate cyclase (GGDEF)-like protein